MVLKVPLSIGPPYKISSWNKTRFLKSQCFPCLIHSSIDLCYNNKEYNMLEYIDLYYDLAQLMYVFDYSLLLRTHAWGI